MKRITTYLLALAMTVGMALSSPAAIADVRDSRGRFLFAPETSNDDPVNLIQIGGLPASLADDEHCYFQPSFRIARTPRCFAEHVGDAWKRGEMKERNVPRCNGKDRLAFRSRPIRRDQNNRSTSTSSRCKTQYHLRMWDDDAVNQPYGEWTVGVIYHETRGFCSICDFETQGDHVVDEHWETSELIALREIIRSTDGEERYCVQDDYRPVPGQTVGRDKRNLYNNGRISRVSVQKPDEDAPSPRRCVGR